MLRPNKAWYCGEKPGCAPGRTYSIYASCGVSETRQRGTMNERGISGRFRFAGSAPRCEHGEEPPCVERQAKPRRATKIRRRRFGDDRRERKRRANRPYQKESAAKAKKRRTLTRQEYKQDGKESTRNTLQQLHSRLTAYKSGIREDR